MLELDLATVRKVRNFRWELLRNGRAGIARTARALKLLNHSEGAKGGNCDVNVLTKIPNLGGPRRFCKQGNLA